MVIENLKQQHLSNNFIGVMFHLVIFVQGWESVAVLWAHMNEYERVTGIKRNVHSYFGTKSYDEVTQLVTESYNK